MDKSRVRRGPRYVQELEEKVRILEKRIERLKSWISSQIGGDVPPEVLESDPEEDINQSNYQNLEKCPEFLEFKKSFDKQLSIKLEPLEFPSSANPELVKIEPDVSNLLGKPPEDEGDPEASIGDDLEGDPTSPLDGSDSESKDDDLSSNSDSQGSEYDPKEVSKSNFKSSKMPKIAKSKLKTPQFGYKCKFCPPNTRSKMTYTSRNNLNKHISYKHPFPNERIERDDSDAFVTPTFPCLKCPEVFQRRKHLTIHKSTAHPMKLLPKVWTCGLCPRGFAEKRKLRLHILKVHPGAPIPQSNRVRGSYSCPVEGCGKVFDYPRKLSAHSVTHLSNRPRPHMCAACGKTYMNRCDLQIHERRDCASSNRNKLSEVMCEVCSKVFKHSSYLKAHMACHQQGKYCCSICGKNASTPSLLKAHEATHNTEKNFQCESCPKSFTTPAYLDFHRKRVHIEKPFQCPTCFKKFHYKSRLTAHAETHIDLELPCKFNCGRIFRTRESMEAHIRKEHRKERTDFPFKCEVDPEKCRERFSRKMWLDQHVQRVHIIGYKCGICNGEFLNARRLYSHKSRVHKEESKWTKDIKIS